MVCCVLVYVYKSCLFRYNMYESLVIVMCEAEVEVYCTTIRFLYQLAQFPEEEVDYSSSGHSQPHP